MAFVPGGTTKLKYEFLESLELEFESLNMSLTCKILSISIDAYRKWKYRKKAKTDKQLQLEKFIPLVYKSWEESNYTFGYREIYNELVEKHDDVNLSLVRRIKLDILKLPEIREKRFVTRKGYNAKKSSESANVYDDLVETIKDRPTDNSVLCTDTTEVKLNNKKYYVGILSEGPNELPGTLIYAANIHDNLSPESVLDLLDNVDIPEDKKIIHSDRGGMYKSLAYAEKIKELNLTPSMSKAYRWYHNHWVENVNGQLKDFLRGKPPRTFEELQQELDRFVARHNAKVMRKRKKASTNQ